MSFSLIKFEVIDERGAVLSEHDSYEEAAHTCWLNASRAWRVREVEWTKTAERTIPSELQQTIDRLALLAGVLSTEEQREMQQAAIETICRLFNVPAPWNSPKPNERREVPPSPGYRPGDSVGSICERRPPR